jgi:hypothetical protein
VCVCVCVCKEREREREAGGRGRECPRERGSAVGMCTRIWRRRREEKGKRDTCKKSMHRTDGWGGDGAASWAAGRHTSSQVASCALISLPTLACHICYTVAFRDIETTWILLGFTVFDPASVFLNTLMKSEPQPASFFQKRPVVSIKQTYSAGVPPACF